MTYALGAKSLQRLQGVHPDLVRVVKRAISISPQDFTVVEGLRTKARQAELYAQGRTKPGPKVTWTLQSKHIDGMAVDLAPWVDGAIDWNTVARFDRIALAMFRAAALESVRIRWGADWDGDGLPREKGESDSPHFEMAS